MASFLGRLLSQLSQSLGEGINTAVQDSTQMLQKQIESERQRSDGLIDTQLQALGQALTNPNLSAEEAQMLIPRMQELMRLRGLPPEQRGPIPDYLSDALPIIGRAGARLGVQDFFKNSELVDQMIGGFDNADSAVNAILQTFSLPKDSFFAPAIENLVRARYERARDMYLTETALRGLGISREEYNNRILSLQANDLEGKIKFDKATFDARVKDLEAKSNLAQINTDVAKKTAEAAINKAFAEAQKVAAEAKSADLFLRKLDATIQSEIEAAVGNNMLTRAQANALIPLVQDMARTQLSQLLANLRKTEAEAGLTEARAETEKVQQRLMDSQTALNNIAANKNQISNVTEATDKIYQQIATAASAIAAVKPGPERDRLIKQFSDSLGGFVRLVSDTFGNIPFVSDPTIIPTLLETLSNEKSAEVIVNRLKNADSFINILSKQLANTVDEKQAAGAIRSVLQAHSAVFGLSNEQIEAIANNFKTQVGLLKMGTQEKRQEIAAKVAQATYYNALTEQARAQIVNEAEKMKLSKEMFSEDKRKNEFNKWATEQQIAISWESSRQRWFELNMELQSRLQDAKAGGANTDSLKLIGNVAETANKLAQDNLTSLYQLFGCIQGNTVSQTLSAVQCDGANQLIQKVAQYMREPNSVQITAEEWAGGGVTLAMNFLQNAELVKRATDMVSIYLDSPPTNKGEQQPRNPNQPPQSTGTGGASQQAPQTPGTGQTRAQQPVRATGYGGNLLQQTRQAPDPRSAGYVLSVATVEGGPPSAEFAPSGAWGPLQMTRSSGFTPEEVAKGCNGDPGCIALKQAEALLNEPSRAAPLRAAPSPVVAATGHFLPSLLYNPDAVIFSNGKPPNNAPNWLKAAYDSNKPLFEKIAQMNQGGKGRGDIFASDVGAYYVYRAIDAGDLPNTIKPEVKQYLGLGDAALDYDALRIAAATAAVVSTAQAGIYRRGELPADRQLQTSVLSRYIATPVLLANLGANPMHPDNRNMRREIAINARRLGYNTEDKEVQKRMDAALGWLLSWNLDNVGRWATGGGR